MPSRWRLAARTRGGVVACDVRDDDDVQSLLAGQRGVDGRDRQVQALADGIEHTFNELKELVLGEDHRGEFWATEPGDEDLRDDEADDEGVSVGGDHVGIRLGESWLR